MAVSLSRWRLPFFTCWLLFVNHYARDVMGALEKQIEEGFHITKASYGLLNSIYFIPNLVVPLALGAVAQKIGSLTAVTIVIAVSAVGHLLVGFSASAASFPCLLIGRAVLGICYESIDIMPLPILGKDYKDSWGLMVGMFNGFLRMGSVCNFLLSPLIYRVFGLAAALWASSCFGLSGLGAVVVMRRLSRRPACGGTCSDGLVGTSLGSEASTRASTAPDSEVPEACGGALQTGTVCLPRQFWLYCSTGMLMYAGIVPFWFFGSGYIQEAFSYSLEAADLLMLLPEGMIAVLSPPIGIYVDRAMWSGRRRLRCLSVALVFFPLSYLLLLVKWVPPLFSMTVLGSGWAFSNCLFWSLSAYLVPENLLAVGSGIIGASLNLGATLLPYLMARLSDGWALGLLVFVTAGSALLATVTAASTSVE